MKLQISLLCHGRSTELSARAEDFGSSADTWMIPF